MFKSIQHFFAKAAHGVVIAAKATKNAVVQAGHATPAVAAALAKAEPIVEGVTAVVAPGAVTIERVAFHCFGEVAAAVVAAGEAADANGVNVQLDKVTIEKVRLAVAALAELPAAL